MTKINKILPLVLLAVMLVGGTLSAATEPTSPSVVNINTATVEQLTALPHIGPKRAQMIVERREQKPFASVDELLEIKGIGNKTLEKIRPHVAVAAPKQP